MNEKELWLRQLATVHTCDVLHVKKRATVRVQKLL